ncbi:MAG TPA: hypothetical protein VI653_09975 [Steroidobacteraceae bacterium]
MESLQIEDPGMMLGRTRLTLWAPMPLRLLVGSGFLMHSIANSAAV